MLAVVARRFEGVFDEVVRDSGALEIEGVRQFFGFSEGEVADHGVRLDLVDNIGRHGVTSRFPGLLPGLGAFKSGSNYPASRLMGCLHAHWKKHLPYREPRLPGPPLHV